MDITVHLPDVARLADAIEKLAGAGAPPTTAPAAKKPPTKKAAPVKDEAKPEEETTTAPDISEEDVRALLQKAAKQDREAAKKVVNGFAEHFNDVSKNDYPALVEALNKLVN